MTAVLGLAGCEDSMRQTVQVRPPVAAPAPPTMADTRMLPLNTFSVRVAPPLRPPMRPNGLDVLIAWATAVYEEGVKESNAGHRTQAKADFDGAVAGLANSGFDVRADVRLAPLYDKLLETAHVTALSAQTNPDLLGEQPSVPAPIDALAEMDLTPDPGLYGETANALAHVPHDLPITVNDTVLTYLNFFRSTRGRAIVEAGLRRAGRYQDMIRRVFREEGLPQDLIYLAQAESGFQPQALSKAGARGIWQFMAWRAREYGLQKTYWVDERQDPEKATRAAARHLRDLYGMFGDWYLAMAAYDCGPGNVAKGIERTGYADFWELYKRNVLPKETKNYVPIILAFMLTAKNAEHFGIVVQPEAPLKADVVKPGNAIDLRLVAESLDVDLDTLRTLNPALLRMVTPTDAAYELRLPAGEGARFETEIAASIPPEKWVSWRMHTVEEGDTLKRLALKFKVTSNAIAQANRMDGEDNLEVGKKVIIPVDSTRPDADPAKVMRYRVRKTDTLQSIADEFDVTTAELKRWNGLRGEHVSPGVRLKIYPGGHGAPPATTAQSKPKTPSAPAPARTPTPVARKSAQSAAPAPPDRVVAPETAKPVVHKVKQGETLWSIAQAYRTTVDAVKNANQFLLSRQLQVGDQLTILPPR
jgi:membrane-bound lytic murein transglycosylase D